MTEEEKRAASHQGGALGETTPASVETQQNRRLGNQAQVMGAPEAAQLNHRWAAYRDIANRPDADPADREEASKRAQFIGNLLQQHGGLKQYTTGEHEQESGFDTFSRNYAQTILPGVGNAISRHVNTKAGITPEEQQNLDRADMLNDRGNRIASIAGSVAGSGASPAAATYSALRGPVEGVLGGLAARATSPVGSELARGAAAIGTETIPAAVSSTVTGGLEGGFEPAPSGFERLRNIATGAKQALQDPSTYALPAIAGAGAAGVNAGARGVVGSKGGNARALLEAQPGVKAGPLGVRGGVFENELKGIPAETPARQAQAMLRSERPPIDMEALKDEAFARAKPIAEKQYANIEKQYEAEAQKAARLKDQAEFLTSKMEPDQDISRVVEALKETRKHPGALEALPKVNQALDILEQYRQPDGRVLVTPSILNEVRGMLSGLAGVGKKDFMLGKQFPLAQAAGEARTMVQEGPFGGANEAFTEAYGNRRANRLAAGLSEDLPKRTSSDLKALTNQEYHIQKHTLRKTATEQEVKAIQREQELANLQGAREALQFDINPAHPLRALKKDTSAIAGRLLYGPAQGTLEGQGLTREAGLGGRGSQMGAATIGAAREAEKERGAARADALIPTLMIDRIEHGKAVLVDEDGNEKVVPRMSLPKGAQAGGWIRGGSIVPAPKSESQAIRKKLSAGDKGGNFALP